MAWIKETHSITHHVYMADQFDDNNEPIDAWADPVEKLVIGWAVPGSDLEDNKHRTAVVRDLDVYSLTNFTGPKDELTIDGKRYKVVGDAEDYTHGPFGFDAGWRINCKRAVDLG